MRTYSEEQIRDIIRRASLYAGDDYIREHLANLRSSKKRYESRKSPLHQHADWDEVEDYAYRLEMRVTVLLATRSRPE